MMRFILLLSALLASCGPHQPNSTNGPLSSIRPDPTTETSTQETTERTAQAQPSELASSLPKQPPAPPKFVRTSLAGISIDAVTFDSRTHFLAVADQAGGPGSLWGNCRAAGKANGGLAAINAGFFTPEGKPLGKVIANGSPIGAINRASSLGSGFYVQSDSGRIDLIRRERFNGGFQALQSGPFLTEGGRAVGGLSDKQSSARSFIAYDGVSRWIIARTNACSLSALAQALEGQSIDSIRLIRTLNLDGGRSSEIWASDMISGGPHFERPFWNKPVRNYLIVKTRG